MRVEKGDLDRWVIDLEKALSSRPDEAYKVVEKGALNIKKGAQAAVGKPPHAPAYAASITYDMYRVWRGPEAEIGPDTNKRQGHLGNLLEYGSVNNRPHPHIAPAVDTELPKFETAMEDLAAAPLEG